MAITKIQSESLNLSDTYDFTGTVTGAGGVNTPYFYARKTSGQTITNTVTTKVTFDSIILDTNSDWDATNNRFTPQTPGKYFFHTDIMIAVGAVSELIVSSVRLKKNDTTTISYHQIDARNNYLGYSNNLCTSNIVDMNGTTDFMEVHAYANDNSGNPEVAGNSNQSYTSFMAFKIIE